MKKAKLKSKLMEELKNQELVLEKHGTIKKVIIDGDRESGFIGVFYKNLKPFETYKGLDTRPVQIFSYSVEVYEEEQEDDVWVECVEVWIDLHFDCNGNDDEWKEKKEERMSDREFMEFWT